MASFEVNINAQVAAGVNGIILGGTLGEASTLTDEEKKLVKLKSPQKFIVGFYLC